MFAAAINEKKAAFFRSRNWIKHSRNVQKWGQKRAQLSEQSSDRENKRKNYNGKNGKHKIAIFIFNH